MIGLVLAVSTGAAYAFHTKPTVDPPIVSVQPAPTDSEVTRSRPAPGAPGPMPTGVAESLSVSVLPGGPLRVSPKELTLRVSGDHKGSSTAVGEIEVVDPRGSLAGWVLTVRLADHSDVGGHVEIVPGPPVAVDGDPAGLVPGGRAPLRAGHPVRLASSLPGHGGGTYRVSVSVSLEGNDLLARVPLQLDLD